MLAYQDRQALISALEEVRGSRVIGYVLGDREAFPPAPGGFLVTMTGEPHLLFADLLAEVGKVDHLDLFLYTRGGMTESVWPLVNLLRTHCEHLSVLVPFRAHSAGTLLCLGADEVVMGELGELSPIDPTTGNQFNPRDPLNAAQSFGISVEDVTAYFDLARERAGIKDERDMVEVLKQLTASVHPLALGNVQRVYMMIRRMATELLALHLERDDEKFKAVVKGLTTEFYTHLHAISQQEAKVLLGDWVRSANGGEEAAMRALFASYAETLELRTRYNLPDVMGDQPVMDVAIDGAFLESTAASYCHTTSAKVMQRPNLPAGYQVQVPPGQMIPLVPWASRTFEWSFQSVGWRQNTEGK